MIPFNGNSEPDNSLSANGVDFSINETFMLICNKPIPKQSKVYFEFSVKSYTKISNKRNIPIYAGIHREPAAGVLNNGFCIGSLFYTEGQDYDIIEDNKKSVDSTHSIPTNIYCRIPGATDIIGVGVDYTNNLISFYNNGKLFYSFSPSTFNINEWENFYFCIWGNIPCKLQGYANFGRTGTSYLPDGYHSLYGEYYRRVVAYSDIDGTITVEQSPTFGSIIKDINCTIRVTNDIKGDGSLFLLSNQATITDGLKYSIPSSGGMVSCNLPIPTERKIYLELTAKDGVFKDGKSIGIPISVGISNTPTSVQSISMRMPLYHKEWYPYYYIENVLGTSTSIEIKDVDTPIPTEQGKTIGVCLDLSKNQVSILVNNIHLYTFTSINTNFKDKSTFTYLFIRDEGMCSTSIDGIFNFGQTSFKFNVPNGYESLYDYYNRSYMDFMYKDLNCSITVKPYYTEKVKYIHGTITVPEIPDPNESKFATVGINKLMKTYNIVSDNEPHQTINMGFDVLQGLIKANNNGYSPD